MGGTCKACGAYEEYLLEGKCVPCFESKRSHYDEEERVCRVQEMQEGVYTPRYPLKVLLSTLSGRGKPL